MQKTLTNDKDILLRLLQQAYNDDSLSQSAKREYEKLTARFDEEGTDLEIADSDIDVGRAAAFHELSETGYVDHLLRFHGMNEGHVLHVTLRARQFLEMMIRLEDGRRRGNFRTKIDAGFRQTGDFLDRGRAGQCRGQTHVENLQKADHHYRFKNRREAKRLVEEMVGAIP